MRSSAAARTARTPLLAAAGAALFAAAALPAAGAQQPTRPQGVTILEDRDLATRLADARGLVEAGQLRAAVALIDEVLAADPAALIRYSPDDLLYLGAREAARRALAALPEGAFEEREKMIGGRAEAELLAALDPPDLPALQRIEERYTGTAAGRRARMALHELLLDRGYAERAARGRPIGELLPAEWVASLPAPRPSAPLLTPSYSGLQDPAIPVVRASTAGRSWEFEFRYTPPAVNYAHHRMALGGAVGYLTDGREVVAVDLATGEAVWRHSGPDGWDQHQTPGQLMEGFDPDMLLAPVLEDGVLLVPMHEPKLLGRSEDFRRIAVRRYLPARRLWAFDAETGAVLWKQSVDWMEGRQPEPRGMVVAPPAVAAGRVFVPVYDAVGTVDLSMLALDLHTGERLWRTFLVSGQRETTNLFGNVLQEPACGVPAADSERVIVCTNLGAVCALDSATGAALWTRLYERTAVRPFQTGMLGTRPEFYSNDPPVYSDGRFVCAPTDSEYALAVDIEGELVALWRSSTVHDPADLRHPFAALPYGVWFNGVSVNLRTVPGQSGRQVQSRRLWDHFGHVDQRHGAVLAAGEILVPTADGIERLDPATGRMLSRAVSWRRHNEAGSLQAGPGVLLVMRSGGVIAYTSPPALLEYLELAQNDVARLAQVLPFLEGMKLADRPTALRVAGTAASVREETGNKELAERLGLVAGSALLDAGESARAAAALEPLLESESRAHRVRAALTLVDALERRPARVPLLRRALQLLESEAPAQLVRRGGEREPLPVVLARTRYLIAQAQRDSDAARRALVGLLQVEDAGSATEAGVPILRWAANEQARLLRDPRLAAAHEREAVEVFRHDPVPPGMVRAYSGTRPVAEWLGRQIRREDLGRAEVVRFAAWLRDFVSDNESSPEALLDAERLFGRAELPPLPASLDLLERLDLDEQRLLDARRYGDSVLLLLQDADHRVVVLMELRADRLATEWWRRRVAGSETSVPFLDGRGFLSEDAATLVFRDRWVRIGLDGEMTEIQLPGRCDLPDRIGRMAATLCRNSQGQWWAQVRDLDTAELFLDYRLPERDFTADLAVDGRRLFVLRDGQDSVLRIDPVSSSRALQIPLPQAPNASETMSALPFGEDVLVRAGSHLVVGSLRRQMKLPQSTQQAALPFSAPGGVGWMARSTSTTRARFFWLAEGSDTPAQSEYPHQEIKVPQIEAPYNKRIQLDDPLLLVLNRTTPQDGVRLEGLKMDAGRGGPSVVWREELADLRFSQLSRRQPEPVRGANGWLLPLMKQRSRSSMELQMLLLDESGREQDRYTAPPTRSAVAHVQTFPVEGSVILRIGTNVYWLGES